jgi:uncharacterized protein (DUF2062 family)
VHFPEFFSAKPVKALFNLKESLSKQYDKLKHIRDAPHAVAGGVAIGIFWGFTPLLGFKTLLSVLFAWISRCSKISAVIAVTFHDILTPIWPIILRWEYDLGFWIVKYPHHFPEKLSIEDARLSYWFHFRTLDILWPMFVGSLVFAIPSALISYWIVKQSLAQFERKRHAALKPPVESS